MSAALNEFRNIAFLLYKIAKPEQHDTMNELLMRIQILLEVQESRNVHDHDDCCDSPIRILSTPPLIPLTPPQEVSDGPSPPTLVIHPDAEVPPNVVVTKEPDQTKTVKVLEPLLPLSTPTPQSTPVLVAAAPAAPALPPANEVDTAEDKEILADLKDEPEAEEEAEEEDEPEAEEEAEEDEPEAEEEADVEEDYDVEKIGKRRYFVGQITRKVYERIDAETIGEYLGVLRDGKIVPN